MSDSLHILADLHTHTLFSRHAYSTLQENITAAVSNGMQYLAVTDHYYGDGTELDRENEVSRFRYLPEINRYVSDIKIIGGGEFNLGQTPFQWNLLQHLTWKLTGLHRFHRKPETLSAEEVYHLFCNAAAEYTAFAHIERSLHKISDGRYGCDLCPEIRNLLEQIVMLAKQKHIYLEVNERSFSQQANGSVRRLEYWLSAAREMQCLICIGSDAHYAGQIGSFPHSEEILSRLAYPEELILNCREDLLRQFVSGGEEA